MDYSPYYLKNHYRKSGKKRGKKPLSVVYGEQNASYATTYARNEAARQYAATEYSPSATVREDPFRFGDPENFAYRPNEEPFDRPSDPNSVPLEVPPIETYGEFAAYSEHAEGGNRCAMIPNDGALRNGEGRRNGYTTTDHRFDTPSGNFTARHFDEAAADVDGFYPPFGASGQEHIPADARNKTGKQNRHDTAQGEDANADSAERAENYGKRPCASAPPPDQANGKPKRKRDWGGILTLLICFLCFGIVIFAAPFFTGEKLLETVGEREHTGEYWYVIGGQFEDKNTAEARARALVLGGGAGYLLYDGKVYSAVLSAYPKQSDAEKVAAKNPNTSVLCRKPLTFSEETYGKDGAKKGIEFVAMITNKLNILQDTILSAAKGETTAAKALTIINSARAELLNEKDTLMQGDLPSTVKRRIGALADPFIGGIESLNAPQSEVQFLAAMRYVYASSASAITQTA